MDRHFWALLEEFYFSGEFRKKLRSSLSRPEKYHEVASRDLKSMKTRNEFDFGYFGVSNTPYLGTCHPTLPKIELLKIIWPGRWKSAKYLSNGSEGVQCYPEFEAFDTFFIFRALKMSAKSMLSPNLTLFSRQTKITTKQKILCVDNVCIGS